MPLDQLAALELGLTQCAIHQWYDHSYTYCTKSGRSCNWVSQALFSTVVKQLTMFLAINIHIKPGSSHWSKSLDTCSSFPNAKAHYMYIATDFTPKPMGVYQFISQVFCSRCPWEFIIVYGLWDDMWTEVMLLFIVRWVLIWNFDTATCI